MTKKPVMYSDGDKKNKTDLLGQDQIKTVLAE